MHAYIQAHTTDLDEVSVIRGADRDKRMHVFNQLLLLVIVEGHVPECGVRAS